MTAQEYARQAMLDFYTQNPGEIDPKFNGDAGKAADSYVASQAMLTRANQAAAAARTKTAAGPLSIPDSGPQQIGGLMAAMKTEILATGNVSDATRAALGTVGIDATYIDDFVAAAKVHSEQQITQAHNLVGGAEAYAATIAYATTLPQAERSAINAGLSSSGWQTVLLGLHARRLAAHPGTSRETQSLNTSTPGTGTGLVGVDAEIGNNTALYFAAFNDPRYKTDMAFKAGVERATKRLFGKK